MSRNSPLAQRTQCCVKMTNKLDKDKCHAGVVILRLPVPSFRTVKNNYQLWFSWVTLRLGVQQTDMFGIFST